MELFGLFIKNILSGMIKKKIQSNLDINRVIFVEIIWSHTRNIECMAQWNYEQHND